MRVPKRDIPAQPITHLWERQKEIARRLAVGQRQCDIARDLGMTPGRMSIICNSPAFKKYLGSLTSIREERAIDINATIKAGATKGAELLVNILTDEKAHISLKAKVAMDLLDREGHGKISKVQSEVTHHLTGDRIAELKRLREERLKEITFSGPIIEAVVA